MNSIFNPMNLVAATESSTLNIESLISKEDNAMTESFAFFTQLNEEYCNSSKLLYKSILESDGDSEVIQESFSGFFNKFKEIIKKFLNFIKSIFQKFITKLNQLIGRDKHILKCKDQLKNNFTSADNFDFNGYNFNIQTNIPVINAFNVFDNTDDVYNMTTISAATQKDAIVDAHKTLKTSIEGDFYDKMRGDVIGGATNIQEEDFAETLKKTFRSGVDDEDIVTCDIDYITLALGRIENYKKLIDDTEKLKKHIDDDYNKIQHKVESIIKANSTKNAAGAIKVSIANVTTDIRTDAEMTDDVLNEVDAYIKTKTAQIMQMSAIHGMAFAAKLEAIKDSYRQDVAVLNKALIICQSSKKKSIKESCCEEDCDNNEETVDGVMTPAAGLFDDINLLEGDED